MAGCASARSDDRLRRSGRSPRDRRPRCSIDLSMPWLSACAAEAVCAPRRARDLETVDHADASTAPLTCTHRLAQGGECSTIVIKDAEERREHHHAYEQQPRDVGLAPCRRRWPEAPPDPGRSGAIGARDHEAPARSPQTSPGRRRWPCIAPRSSVSMVGRTSDRPPSPYVLSSTLAGEVGADDGVELLLVEPPRPPTPPATRCPLRLCERDGGARSPGRGPAAKLLVDLLEADR